MKTHVYIPPASLIPSLLKGVTQIRVAVKDPPNSDTGWTPTECYFYHPTLGGRWSDQYPGPETYGFADEDRGWPCPFGGPGDVLVVKETWGMAYEYEKGRYNLLRATDDEYAEKCERILYKSIADVPSDVAISWCSPVTMPRDASRLSLVVEDVRVQELGEATAMDALAEGIVLPDMPGAMPQMHPDYEQWSKKRREAFIESESRGAYFAQLTDCQNHVDALLKRWDSIPANRNHPAASNPMTWVATIRKE